MNTTLTPKKRAVLKALARGESVQCGRPTKQALVRDGLAIYIPLYDPFGLTWDREIAITEKGRRTVIQGAEK